MTGLFRDWLLDPTALLFLVSLTTGLLIISLSRRGSRSLSSSRQAEQSPGHTARPSARRWLWLFCGLWGGMFAVFSAPVVVNPLVVALEQWDARSEPCDTGSPIVVLGGGVDSRIRSPQDFSRMSRATFIRATEAAKLALAEPEVRLIVAGGALNQLSEAEVVAEYIVALGVQSSRIQLETKSSNTRENAINVARMLEEERVRGAVRLVTSAMHMHRALGVFEQAVGDADISLCPVAVDAHGLTDVARYAWMPQTTSLVKFDLWLHEVLAIVLYRLRGWL